MLSKSEKIKFIENVFGPYRISANEENVAVSCPLCKSSDKDKKKLSIRLEDDLNHCWVCGWSSYNLLPLLLKIGAGSHIDFYKKNFIIYKSKKQFDNEIEKYDEIPVLPYDYKLLYVYEKDTCRDPDIKVILNYLHGRNVTRKDMAYFCLGMSNDPKYRRRIVVPSFDVEGKINYLVARSIDTKAYPKYINSKNKKTEVIFNELKIDWSKRLNIVEGPFDLMKCPDNSTCILGSEMNEGHKLFVKILENTTPVTLCLDEDAIDKSIRIANRLLSYNVDVKICTLPPNKDPGSMTKKEVADAILSAEDMTRYKRITTKIKKISTTLQI